MRKIYIVFFLLVSCFVNAQNIQPNINEYNQKLNNNNISFTENKGQVYDQNYKPRPDVLYGAMAGNMAVHIKSNGVSYQLYRVDKYKEIEDPKTSQKRKEIDEQTIYRIDLDWLGADKNFTQTTDEELPGYNNYYLESCPNGALNVKSYTGVTLKNLYDGINLHYYQKEGNLKYDYIVAPHANYKQIQIQVKGADVTLNKDGSLTLNTPLCKVKEGEPIVFQRGKQLKAKWVLRHAERSRSVNDEKSSTLNFEVENYDENYELVIDPVTRVWGTYYGGNGEDVGYSTCTDLSGNVYMAGSTTSNASNILATSGSHQFSYGGGTYDAFLVKFNSNGVLQWGTYYGGSLGEYGYSCAADGSGNIYLAGSTQSSLGLAIATTGSHQDTFGGFVDAFLVKFNSSGIRQWSTYYGGSGSDAVYSCSTDATGNVYMVGTTATNSGTTISTPGAHQIAGGGGSSDAFIVKFSSSGIRQWGTYYGGSGLEYGNFCYTDLLGNIFVTGQTASSNASVIATVGTHQTNLGGGADAFLVKFNSNGLRQWGTYYGDNGTDNGYSCCVDASGNVYLSGLTGTSTINSMSTPGSHQPNFGGGNLDGYLVKFSNNGIRLWGTYYGGSTSDMCYSCITDPLNNVYLVGLTQATIGIATPGSQQTTSGGVNDAMIAQFDPTGIRLCGSYYGASSNDFFNSCAIDPTGSVYATGWTAFINSTAIATPSSHQPNYGGGTQDAFLVKFNFTNSVDIIEKNEVLHQDLFNIYPNPTNSEIFIDFFELGNTSYTIELINIIGQVLYKEISSTKNIKLETQQLTTGIYFVKVTVGAHSRLIKVVKE